MVGLVLQNVISGVGLYQDDYYGEKYGWLIQF